MAKEMKIGLFVICVLVFVLGVALVWRLRQSGPAADEVTATHSKKETTCKPSEKKTAPKTLAVQSNVKARSSDHKHEHTHIHSVGHSHEKTDDDRYAQQDTTYDSNIHSSRYGPVIHQVSDQTGDALQTSQQPAQLRLVEGGYADRYAEQLESEPTASSNGHDHVHTYTPTIPRRRPRGANQLQQSAQDLADQSAQYGAYDARYPQQDSYQQDAYSSPNIGQQSALDRYGSQQGDLNPHAHTPHRHSHYEQAAQTDNLPQQQADYGQLQNDYGYSQQQPAIGQSNPTLQPPIPALQPELQPAGYSGDGAGGRAQLAATGTYVVKPNDNFWTISEAVYGTGSYFKALMRHNDERHPLPERLAVGDEVLVPPEATLREKYPQLCPKPRRRSAAYAATGSVATGGGRTYEVQEGDTLFDIAKYELGDPARWVEIYQLNQQLLTDDFDFVKPGLQLVLPGRAGGAKYREDRLTEQQAPSVRR